MAKDPNDELIFRVTCVGHSGVAETRKIKSWRKAIVRYNMLVNSPHMRYVCCVDITDRDPEYWNIRQEWCKGYPAK